MIKIDGYLIDVAEDEEVTLEAEVTTYPVEQGTDVADHVVAHPLTITVTGLVSDTPLGEAKVARSQFTLVGGEAFALPQDEARARLKAIYEAREPVTVELTRGKFENMVLQQFSERRDGQTGDALRFTATFVQVRIVTNLRATVRVAVARAAKKRDLGHLTPHEKELLAPVKDTIDGFKEQLARFPLVGG